MTKREERKDDWKQEVVAGFLRTLDAELKTAVKIWSKMRRNRGSFIKILEFGKVYAWWTWCGDEPFNVYTVS